MRLLKFCVNEVSKKYIPYKMYFISKLQDKWELIVGKNISKHSFPQKIYNKTLFINVDDNIWIQELSFYKDDILEKILKEFPLAKEKNVFESIKFKLGPINKIEKEKVKEKFYISTNILKKINETVKDVKDKELKEALKNYLIQINLKEKKSE